MSFVRMAFPDALEGDCAPTGAYVVIGAGGSVATHLGPLSGPGEPIRFVVLTEVGGRLKFAGQGQDTPATWEWVQSWDSAADHTAPLAGAWRDRGPSFGTSPCLYDAAGELHVMQDGGPGTTSQGYRYLATDGTLVLGDDSRIDELRRLREFTVTGPYVVGQHDAGGVAVHQAGTVAVQLEPGDTHTVRARAAADGTLAVATRKLAERETVLIWASPAGVLAQPPIDLTTPDDPDEPDEPDDPDDPDEEAPRMEAPNRLEVMRAVVAAHPEINALSNEDRVRGRLVDFCARRLNKGADRPWGRKARQKDGGNQNGDGLTYLRSDGRFEIIDVLSGSTGAATWDHKGVFNQGQNGYWAPPGPGEAADPPDVEEPDVILPHSELEARVALMEARLTVLEGAPAGGTVDEQARAAIADVSRRADESAQPGDDVTVESEAVFGRRIKSKGKLT